MLKCLLEKPKRAHLYFHTIRYLKPRQVVGRIVARLRKKLSIPSPPKDLQGGKLSPRTVFFYHEPWHTKRDIQNGRFCFLNAPVDLGRPVDWRASDMSLLWQFNLHYFHYLHLLEKKEQEALCREWIGGNPVGKTVGWHPYPLSLRIVNWCKAGLGKPDIQTSLYQQAAYLYRNLESYHPGNHFLENAKALIFPGLFFYGQGEALHWLQKGLQIYRDETPVQVLEDGGYFERSPMYHALMLEGYLDLLNILPENCSDRDYLKRAVYRMSDFLVSVSHPDGRLALFNDATCEIAMSTASLQQYTRNVTGHIPQQTAIFSTTGYYIHSTSDCFLIIDAGPIGPDYLPAHAHADIFSYELSLSGQAFIVDSGVYEYPAGSMRSYVRSTRAHNTVCVDGVDQVECWGSFRVARRFEPREVRFDQDSQGCQFEGAYYGYTELIGDDIVHRRIITVCNENRLLEVKDIVEGCGKHVVESRIHLHPDVNVSRSGQDFRLQREGITGSIMVDSGSVSLENGWYCPQFGKRQKNTVIVIGGEVTIPFQCLYRIQY